MKLTKALKDWLVKNCGVKETSSDAEFRKAASEAMTKATGEAGFLSAEKFVELTADKDTVPANRLELAFDNMAKGISALTDVVTAQNDRLATLEKGGATSAAVAAVSGAADAAAATIPATTKAGDANASSTRTPSVFEKVFAGAGTDGASIDPADPIVRIKGAHESYSKSKTPAMYPDMLGPNKRHPLAGRRIELGLPGKSPTSAALDNPSELEQAINGAWFKFVLHSEGAKGIPQFLRLTDHDRDLIQYALRNEKWCGVLHGTGSEDSGAIEVNRRKLADFEIKALIDDSTSGGLEVAPIFFDDQVILTPLLTGEFFPLVNVVNITRGRRIEGAAIGNVSFSSGGADDSDIPLFNTAAFVSAFDTSIFVANGAIEIGLDFQSDSPIDVAGIITRSYGQKLLEWLDEQICVGDGSTEPEGVMVASGTTSVSFGNTTPTLGGYESLLFGIPKAFKQGYESSRVVWGMTEQSYQRARSMAYAAGDARRLLGMTHEDYMILGHKAGINEAMANTQQFFCNLGRYRMYRRMGLTMKVTTEGKTLVRRNNMLITARSRWGGQLEDGNAAAVTTTAQA